MDQFWAVLWSKTEVVGQFAKKS